MCMSPYSETLECAISLEWILSATAGRATHGDTHRHTPTLSGGGGAATGPSAETALGGWLAATVRGGPFWWSALPPDTNTLNTPGGTGPGQPPPPRAECSERRGEACSAVTGSQVVGCRVTWGHGHTHGRSLTHPHRDSCHPMSHAQTQPLAHSFTDSCITQIHIIIRKTDKHADARTHRDTLRYLQGDAWMCSDTHTATHPHSHRHVRVHTHTQTQSPHRHVRAHIQTQSPHRHVCAHTQTQSPGV